MTSAITLSSVALAGAYAGKFDIVRNASGHGELRFKNVPNFESPTDSDGDNTYSLTVMATDNGSPSMSTRARRSASLSETSMSPAR